MRNKAPVLAQEDGLSESAWKDVGLCEQAVLVRHRPRQPRKHGLRPPSAQSPPKRPARLPPALQRPRSPKAQSPSRAKPMQQLKPPR